MNTSQYEQALKEAQLARRALDANELDVADRHVKAALQLTPDLLEARITQARLELRRRKPWRAMAALDALDHYHPQARQTPESLFLRADALLQSGSDGLALSLLEQLAVEYPDDIRPHRMLAGLCVRLGHAAQAIAHLRRVIVLAESDGDSRWTLAQLLEPTNPQEAIAVLEAGGGGAEDEHLWRLRLARLYRKVGRLREAEETFAGLLTDFSDDASLWTEAGELADAMGSEDLALRRLAHALTTPDPSRAATLATLARVHMHAGRFAAGGAAWWNLLRKGGFDLDAWAGLVVCALASGKERLAGKALRQLAARTSPQERRQAMARQWHHAAGGEQIARIESGDHHYQPTSVSPLSKLLGQTVRVLEQHRDQFPQRADTHYHLAVALLAMGDKQGAHQATAAALAINPRYGAAKRLTTHLESHPRRAA